MALSGNQLTSILPQGVGGTRPTILAKAEGVAAFLNAYFSVSSIMDATGVSVASAMASTGVGVASTIDSTFGLSSIASDTGVSVRSPIDSTGLSLDGEI